MAPCSRAGTRFGSGQRDCAIESHADGARKKKVKLAAAELAAYFIRSNVTKQVRIKKDGGGNDVEGYIPACASSVVELWFAAADFPKGAVGADVVTKATKVRRTKEKS